MCMSSDGHVSRMMINDRQKDHATWLHPALQEIMKGMAVDGIAITIGPGSYTGLRIGLAAAKGLCFALQIPLVPVNTLEMMAYAAKEGTAALIRPLIDARRMEVFTALYDQNMMQLSEPAAMILDPTSFDKELLSNKIIFCGSGNEKTKAIVNHPNTIFSDKTATAADLAPLAEKYFSEKKFADIAYAEPLYIKEFYFVAR